jgi:hypothetical protein
MQNPAIHFSDIFHHRDTEGTEINSFVFAGRRRQTKTPILAGLMQPIRDSHWELYFSHSLKCIARVSLPVVVSRRAEKCSQRCELCVSVMNAYSYRR